jgi:hypothetical protein
VRTRRRLQSADHEVGLLAAQEHDRVRARHSLVLGHLQGTRLPSGTQAWLTPATRQPPPRAPRRSGGSRPPRSILSGRAVGLALRGGGARGYAHIGVVAALRELGIPIDTIVSACLAAEARKCIMNRPGIPGEWLI